MNQYVTGAMIKRLRENKGMTQQRLAEVMMVSDKAISKWESLVLGNGDSFNRLLETKNLSINDGEAIKRDVQSKILSGLICADRINGAFLTKLCINYSSE